MYDIVYVEYEQERAWKLAFRERDNQQPGCPVFQGIYEKRG